MQNSIFQKSFSLLVCLIIIVNLFVSATQIQKVRSTDELQTQYFIESSVIKISESISERNSHQRVFANSYCEKFYSIEYFADRFIKIQKLTELIFTSSSESNIRLSSFLSSQNSTST